jgi:hypothetical protein
MTGIPLFANQAPAFAAVSYFWLKLLLILLATAVSFVLQRNIARWDRSRSFPASARLLALASFLLWFGVLFASVEVTYNAGV